MKLASFARQGRASFGVVKRDGIIDLGALLKGDYGDLRGLLAADDLAAVAAIAADDKADVAIADVTWLPVIPNPGQILCVGLNYRAHAAEVGRPIEKYPVIFLRVAASQTGHLQPIIRPKVSDAFDYEGELALIVGRPGRYIEPKDALKYIAGYSIYNDASLRDWQRHTHQYTPGKNFPATGPFGPWMVTADEIPDPTTLEITTRLNGEIVQNAPLTDLIFPVEEIVSYVSNFTRLEAGDVIITGTPAGVGSMHKPPRWLKPGDDIEVEIGRIGVLKNSVIQES